MANYSFLSKFLHHLALGNSVMPELCFDIEKNLYSPSNQRCNLPDEQPVFVAGLARSGTTILMRSLYETKQFCSLTYRDMPFVMAPNLWSKISRIDSQRGKRSERAHGDGIQTDFDSPEALEEVFWRTFTGEQYIQADCLNAYKVDQETLEAFKIYIQLIMQKYQSKRYLSKNNNNILRLSSLQGAFPQAAFLVPFRDPLAQASSLLNQHIHFIETHKTDPFSRKYMNWLVHHEFGSNHKPFAAEQKSLNHSGLCSLEYWVEQWTTTYSNIFETYNSKDNIYFIPYELICNNTGQTWKSLCQLLSLQAQTIPNLAISKQPTLSYQDDSLVEQANELYQKMYEHGQGQLLN